MKLRHTSIYLNPDVLSWLRVYAAEESNRTKTRYSMADFINDAVREKMESVIKKNKKS